MKNLMIATSLMLALAFPAFAETKTLNVNGVDTEVTLSASGGFYNLVDPDFQKDVEPGQSLEARRFVNSALATQALNR